METRARPVAGVGADRRGGAQPAPSTRVLDPMSRISEIVFGLIMALTFTGSLSVASAGREEVRTMLLGAIGCNIAWGLVDAIMYLVTELVERARAHAIMQTLCSSDDPANPANPANPAEARRIIAGALPAPIAAVLAPAELDAIHGRLMQAPGPGPARPRARDLLGALAVFLLVVLATIPVVVPFALLTDAGTALRLSNAIAIVMLFLCGWRLGQYVGFRPWQAGLAMAITGSVLVAVTMALGG